MMRWLAQLIQPEIFAEIDIEQDTRAFFQDYFGYSLTDEDLAQIFAPMPMRTASNPAPALEQTPRRPCSFPVLFLGCLAALLILTILAIGVGRYAISPATVVRVLLSRFLPIPATWEGQAESVIFTLRLPRILAALLVGERPLPLLERGLPGGL